MLSLGTSVYTLLTNASDLTAAIGKPYTTQIAEIWSLPNDITYPVLAIDLSGRPGNVPKGISQTFFDYSLRLWYVTTTSKAECMAMADALKAKLHEQQAGNAAALSANWIELEVEQIGRVPQTTQYQAYLEFSIVA